MPSQGPIDCAGTAPYHATVALLFRQFVGSMTALMVLLCSVYCACGSSESVPHDADEAVGVTSTPHCPGHHDDDGDHQGNNEHSKSQHGHHHDHDSSCDHCQPALSAGSGKALTDL